MSRPVGANPTYPRSGGTVVAGHGQAGHVQLDVVVDDLSRNVSANSAERPIDSGRLELPNGTALDADKVVMTLINTSEAVHGSSVHLGDPADHPSLDEELDGPKYRCPAHRRQRFTERLRSKAFILLLKELGYRLSFPWVRWPYSLGFPVPPSGLVRSISESLTDSKSQVIAPCATVLTFAQRDNVSVRLSLVNSQFSIRIPWLRHSGESRYPVSHAAKPEFDITTLSHRRGALL